MKTETSNKAAIGIDIKELNLQWHKYLKKEYWPDISTRDDIQDIARQNQRLPEE